MRIYQNNEGLIISECNSYKPLILHDNLSFGQSKHTQVVEVCKNKRIRYTAFQIVFT